MEGTYLESVIIRLLQMELQDEFIITDFVISTWGSHDQFKRRCFDVYFCKAKQNTLLIDKTFRRSKDRIIRIS